MYKPEVQSAVTAQVMCKRQLAKQYRDQSAKQLPSLVIGQPVQVKAQPQQPRSDWKPGVILENIAPRSYLVEVNRRIYCRNHVHLRNAVQSQTDSLPVQEPDPAQTPGLPENKPANNDHDLASNQPLLRKVPATSTSSNTVTPPASSNVIQTRSGQIVKPITTCLRTLFSESFKNRTDLSSYTSFRSFFFQCKFKGTFNLRFK